MKPQKANNERTICRCSLLFIPYRFLYVKTALYFIMKMMVKTKDKFIVSY